MAQRVISEWRVKSSSNRQSIAIDHMPSLQETTANEYDCCALDGKLGERPNMAKTQRDHYRKADVAFTRLMTRSRHCCCDLHTDSENEGQDTDAENVLIAV